MRSDLTDLIKHSQTFQMLIRLILHNTSDNTQELMPMLLTKHTTGTNSNTTCDTESIISRAGVFVEIDNNTLYGSKIKKKYFMPKIIRY